MQRTLPPPTCSMVGIGALTSVGEAFEAPALLRIEGV